MSRSPPCRKTLLQTEESLGRRAGYIERCKSGSEGGTRHTYWVNGLYPTQCRVGGWPGSFWTASGRVSTAARGVRERNDRVIWGIRLWYSCVYRRPRLCKLGVKVDVLAGRRVYLPTREITRRHPSSAVFSLDARPEAHHEVPRVRRTAGLDARSGHRCPRAVL